MTGTSLRYNPAISTRTRRTGFDVSLIPEPSAFTAAEHPCGRHEIIGERVRALSAIADMPAWDRLRRWLSLPREAEGAKPAGASLPPTALRDRRTGA